MEPFQILAMISVFLLSSENACSLKACQVFCDCIPEPITAPWALRATCKKDDLMTVPRLTPNVTYIKIDSFKLLFIDGLAFSDAPSLKSVYIGAKNLAQVHKDAFQALANLSSITIKTRSTVHFGIETFRNLNQLKFVKLTTNLTQIPSQDLCGTSKLQRLYLNENRIASVRLHPCVEQTWTNLSVLILTDNPLGSIKAEDFYHLRNIQVATFSINRCGLAELDSDVFQYLTHVRNLDLGGNKIKTLPHGIVDSLSSLKILSLKGSYVTELPFSENAPFVATLEQLNLGSCQKLNLTFGRDFLKATRLKFLIMNNLKLDVIDNILFANFINSPIIQLNLRASRVSEISSKAFEGLHSLERIDLSDNRVESEDIRNLSQSVSATLQSLTIDNTFLTKVSNSTFEGFPHNNSLDYLSLQNNKMTGIGRNSFARLRKVTQLNLNHNSLTLDNLDFRAFAGLDSFETLQLESNILMDMPSTNRFSIPTTLQRLYLGHNGLAFLTFGKLVGYNNLTFLSLPNNNIKRIADYAFKSELKMLSILDLTENRMVSIHESAFHGLVSLEYLKLAGNKLRTMSPNALTNLKLLKQFKIDTNSHFAEYGNDLAIMFKGLVNLAEVNLRSCAIDTLPAGMFNDNHKLLTLQLSNNDISFWDSELFQPTQNACTVQ